MNSVVLVNLYAQGDEDQHSNWSSLVHNVVLRLDSRLLEQGFSTCGSGVTETSPGGVYS